ncbi:MAG: A/G-specific adenine glycosylase [Limisphaerales bacterium]
MNRIKNQKTISARINNPVNSVNPVSKVRRLVPLLLDWFATNARDLPWRRTRDPYAIWVSEIMLQQTQVKTVIPFWERWMHELPTIEAAANAPSAKIHKLWEGLGYYTRVRNLQKAAQVIVEKHAGKFPENFDDVLALPGIGRYTAGAICSIAFNQPKPLLDGNVIRVFTRIFGIAENPKEKITNARLWQLADELVTCANERWGETTGELDSQLPSKAKAAREDARPTKNNSCSHLNQSLMELGALICTPRNPQCLICPVKKICVAFKENRTEELPNLGKREVATARRFVAFAIEHKGKFLVRQRPAGVVNAHLWEFPNVEVGAERSEPQEILAELDALRVPDPRSQKLERLCTVKHSITRYRITLEAFVVRLKKIPQSAGGVWRTPAQMQSLAFTSAHRKVLQALIAKVGD